MTQGEGVVKYRLNFHETVLADRDPSLLNAWREVLGRLGMVGCDPERYGGLGFGNLSMRTASGFLVTGTQTGQKPRLMLADYAEVTGWDLEGNAIEAKGQTRPSSEALTHASIYDVLADVNFVFHGHSPEIWRAAGRLALTVTAPDVAYGTPAMAREVAARLRPAGNPGILAMGGHEDGVVAFAASAERAGLLMTGCLAQAVALGQQDG